MGKWLWSLADAITWVAPVGVGVIALYAADRFSIWQSSGNPIPADEIRLITILFWLAISLCIILFVARYAVAYREYSEKDQQQKLGKQRKELVTAIGNFIEQADKVKYATWNVNISDSKELSRFVNEMIEWELSVGKCLQKYDRSYAQIFNASPNVGVVSTDRISDPIQLRKWVEFRCDKLYEILRLVA